MKRFIEGTDRGQSTLLPDCLDDWIDDDNPVRAVDVFVDGLDLNELGFGGVVPETTGVSCRSSQITSKLRPASRSSRRLDWTRLR